MAAKDSTKSASEAWSTTASTGYATNVGRSSAVSAEKLVKFANSLRPFDGTSTVLDVGAGTGAVTLRVAIDHPSSHVHAVDIAEEMLKAINAHQLPQVSTQELSALELNTLGQGKYSHVFSAFVLQCIKTPDTVLSLIHGALQPNGVIGLGIWGTDIHPYKIWQKACQSIDPSFDMGPPYDDDKAWKTPEQLQNHLTAAGFVDLKVEEFMTPFTFPSAEAFLEFWFGSRNPAADSVIKRWKGDMSEARAAVKKIIEEDYDNGKGLQLQAVVGVARKPNTEWMVVQWVRTFYNSLTSLTAGFR